MRISTQVAPRIFTAYFTTGARCQHQVHGVDTLHHVFLLHAAHYMRNVKLEVLWQLNNGSNKILKMLVYMVV